MLEVFQVYRKHPPALLSWPYQPGLLRTYQYLRPRHRSDVWSSHVSTVNLMHNQKRFAAGMPHRLNKNAWGNRCTFPFPVHILPFSPLVSWFFAVGFITLECPLEYCSGVKLPHLIQCIALGSRFYILYLMLDSEQDASIFPNPTSLPPHVSPWLRGLTNL